MALGTSAVPCEPRRTFVVRSAAHGTVVEEIPIDGPAAVTDAVTRARSAQRDWGAMPVAERARRLKQARREMVRDRAEILGLLDAETGKARFDTVGELVGACIELGYLARRAKRFLAPRKVRTWPLVGKRAFVVYKPRGVVGVISPWNAPLNLALTDTIPALLAGNAVVVKPSEITPLAVRRAVTAMRRALPPDVLQVVMGAGATGAALVDHVDMVCVTGSPETGRRVMERASRRLTPVLLELGGKDPMIVLRDADLDRAAAAAVWGGCMMTGQVCMSVERVYVEAPVADAFCAKVVQRVRALRIGPNGRDADIDLGPFTGPNQLAIVERHVADARARGATVLVGGARRDAGGMFYEPTVLAGVDHSMLVMQEETFGPVIPIMTVAGAEEAVELANRSPYGLNASVWTRDIERGLALARRVESGSVCVNECLVSAGCTDLPFGGIKQSGVGTRHGGADGLRQFCIPQSVLIERRRRRTREPNWFPYSAKRAQLLERMMGFLWGR